MSQPVYIDINCDMGESYGRWTLGHDEEVMPNITSANIACGFHGGDPHVMRQPDLEMPELGGFELITRLRKDERFKATPIVIITSRANPEHRRRARDLGVRALVAKPITRRKLLEALAAR